ncbi:PREDICTED: F-box/LRR-repeat protein At4g14103 isoform X1 [Prunus mume]|uniref:F-box/LRR-repeat protein At4g14103 isoform X1 n=2 Tax=Prunus mume TaxID=102107 RepID=A0ABM0NL36_PRUMU|nr:PREDICTED: F-box/LRR-repeat protein At4g14103 isoform X1 [Prunus mume]
MRKREKSKMRSNSKFQSPACTEDRISGLPDEILCHILSFLPTVQAVRTTILSHRWNHVWASVPNIDLCDNLEEFDQERFAGLVDHVLYSRGNSSIHRFRLHTKYMAELPWLDDWICTAITHNVVELDVDLARDSFSSEPFELPRSLYMCKTLVVLKLKLPSIITFAPHSDCFPSLKFLHVNVACPDAADSMGKLFTCCPVLEDLTIEAEPDGGSVLNVNISAPQLKRLRMNVFLCIIGEYYDYKTFIHANTPNLEKFSFDGNVLAVFSSKNAKSLKIAKNNFEGLHAGSDAAELLHRHFAGIGNVEYLGVSAPIFGDPRIVYRYRLPMLNNLKHLVLLFQSCCSWQSLINFLNASPNLESLTFNKHVKCLIQHNKDELVHEWTPPESVPICLLSHLKTVRMQRFRRQPDEMKVAEYLLKHSEVLDYMIFCTRATYLREEKKLWDEVQKFPRVSQTCKIMFPKVCTENF